MIQTLILVSGNPEQALSEYDIAQTEDILLRYDVVCNHPFWLHPEKAVEVNALCTVNSDMMKTLREEYLDARQIDLFCIPQDRTTRRKKLLLADMDATIIEGETLDDLAGEAGLKDKISAITERAMRGELDFQSALTERVAMLENLPVTALQTTLDKMKINHGAHDVIRVMKKFGAECYLVSGGFTFFTENIAKICGFNGHHGNTLEIANERLTGKVVPPILDKDAKFNFLEFYRHKLGLTLEETMAVGDGANDIPMLRGAGLGVGFHPKPAVKESMDNHIIHTDLTSLLYIQGYTEADMTL